MSSTPTPKLTPLVGGAPDVIDLELLSLGLEGEAAERILAASEGPLRGEAEGLERDRRAWEAEHPPLQLPPEVIPPAVPPAVAPANRGWRLTVGLSALVALVAMALLWLVVPSQPEVRAMGALPVDVVVLRGGEVLSAPWALDEGDGLQLGFVAPRTGYVDVVTRQEDGQAQVWVAGQYVEAGERFTLPGQLRLDGYEGEEKLVVTLREQAHTKDEAQALAGQADEVLRREGGWVLDLTRAR